MVFQFFWEFSFTFLLLPFQFSPSTNSIASLFKASSTQHQHVLIPFHALPHKKRNTYIIRFFLAYVTFYLLYQPLPRLTKKETHITRVFLAPCPCCYDNAWGASVLTYCPLTLSHANLTIMAIIPHQWQQALLLAISTLHRTPSIMPRVCDWQIRRWGRCWEI